jgi:two-component system phosphate regulon response regulator PhoB
MGAKVTQQSGRTAAQVLVVDDAPEIRLLARAALERRGFDVTEAEDGETALALIWSGGVDLVVLDVNLPRMSGLAVLTRLRAESSVPVILLTGLTEEADRVLGLELGADDYVVKPFSPAELGARAASVLRRSSPEVPRPAGPMTSPSAAGPAERAPALELRAEERTALVAGVPVELTPKEFDLLSCLATAPRRVFSRDELLEQVWGSAPDWQDPATVTEHVRRLRRKIEDDPEKPGWLQTVRGVGYRFDPAGRA